MKNQTQALAPHIPLNLSPELSLESRAAETEGEQRIKTAQSLEVILPSFLIKQLIYNFLGRKAESEEANAFFSHSGLSPLGAVSMVNENVFVKLDPLSEGFLKGRSVETLGLPVFHGLYQSSRWESGGWDGYNTSIVSLMFLLAFRSNPSLGSDDAGPFNVMLMGHYHFEGQVSDLKKGAPFEAIPGALSFGLAKTADDLADLARKMNVDGYGERAGSEFLKQLPEKEKMLDLLNSAYYEREAIRGAVALPSASSRKRHGPM